MSSDNNERVVAVISGKGGSGKTMLAASMAEILARDSVRPIVLADFDLGTGGLSYYLSLKMAPRIRPGLAELLVEAHDLDVARVPVSSVGRYLQALKLQRANPVPVRLLPIGDHRRALRRMLDQMNPGAAAQTQADGIGNAISSLRQLNAPWLIIDCRGGVDDETLRICNVVDDLILVVEPDTTSFQATQHLVEVLSDFGLSHKVVGFMINKVFEDPSVIERQGAATFGTQWLGSIPFDIAASRSFLVGELPKVDSAFTEQLTACLATAYPDAVKKPSWVMKGKDFNSLATTGPESSVGGTMFAYFMLLCLIVFSVTNWLRPSRFIATRLVTIELSVLCLLGLLGVWGVTRRALGRLLWALLRPLRRRS